MRLLKRKIKRFLTTLKYRLYLQRAYKRAYRKNNADRLRILSSEETLDYLLQHPVSVSRYGDGEINIIRGIGNGFCRPNPALAERLKEILQSDRPNHIVCLPYALKTLTPYHSSAACFWAGHLTKTLPFWMRYTRPGKLYFDALISRFYMDYKDKKGCADIFRKLRRLWEGRQLLIVEGEKSRMGIGNDLFDNAAEVERILCPAENAFEQYDNILKASRKFGKGKLILIALGQTATVLAYDLAAEGCQAIDIGHLDVEYEWFRRQAKYKTAIAGKYVNEAGGDQNAQADCNDSKYRSQIVLQITPNHHAR